MLSAWCLVLGAEEEFEIPYVARRPDGVCNRRAAKCKSRLANREHCEHWNWLLVVCGWLLVVLNADAAFAAYAEFGVLRCGYDGRAIGYPLSQQ